MNCFKDYVKCINPNGYCDGCEYEEYKKEFLEAIERRKKDRENREITKEKILEVIDKTRNGEGEKGVDEERAAALFFALRNEICEGAGKETAK